MVSHWCLSDSTSPQISGSLLNIQGDLNGTVVWIVRSCPLISKSFSPFANALGIVPSVPVTTDITLTFMSHIFLSSLAKTWYLSFFWFYSIFCWDDKVHDSPGSLWLSLVLIVWPRLGVLSLSHVLWVSIFRSDSGLCLYHLFVWSNSIFLHNSLWISFSTQPCLALYSFSAWLLHSLII